MQALLLCAGLGSRMKDLTKDTPKAMVQVNGKPLIAHNLEKLKAAGFTTVVVNVHHFAAQILDYLKAQNNFGLDIRISDESKQLLDTGGAIKKAWSLVDDSLPLLVHNVDIISDLDLAGLMAAHIAENRLATLAVKTRKTTRYLMVEEETLHLAGWTNITTGEVKLSRITTLMVTNYGFSGIHIVSRAMVDLFPEEDAFSIIDVYLDAAKTKDVIVHPHEDDVWVDVGKPENVEVAEKVLRKLLS